MIAKEFRALVPLSLACAATMILCTALGRDLSALAFPVFFIGIAALAAWPIGQEYNYRTLPALLTLPVPRARIWRAKLAAAAPLLFALSTLALVMFPFGRGLPFGRATYYLPALAALFIAPWLTMACRSAVAGAIFTNSIAAMVMLAGAWIGTRRFGYTAEVDRFQFQFLGWTMAGLTAVAAIDGWRMFSKLQAIDGRGADIELSRTSAISRRRRGAARQGVTWLLVRKELRLHQIAWVVAALFAAGYATLVLTRRTDFILDHALTIVIVIHGMVQALLIGSLAAAEERVFGTHDAQLLLPMSSSRQWTIKVLTAIGHVLLLAVALPLALTLVLPVEHFSAVTRRGPIQPMGAAMLVTLTSLALYVSAVSSSGLRALIVSIPVLLGTIQFTQRVGTPVSRFAYRLAWHNGGSPSLLSPRLAESLFDVVLVGFGALMLYRALAHYRSSDPRAWRAITADVACVTGALVAYAALTGVLAI